MTSNLVFGIGSTLLLALAAVLTFLMILGLLWLSRVRASRRFQAVLDRYAEGEMDRRWHTAVRDR